MELFPFATLGLSFLSIILWVHVAFVTAVVLKNNTVADIFWGLGFIAVLVPAWLRHPSPLAHLLFGLVLLWGIRLAVYISARSRGKKEDFRYKKWRKEWGSTWLWRSYLQVFVLQGAFLTVIASAAWWGIVQGGQLNVWGIVGVMVWIIGFLFEAVGDWQKYQFKQNSDNTDKILTTGLWRYTRHPNYFGEVTQWWGIWLIMLTVPFGWLAIISPLTITWLILFVSGIPMLEKKYKDDPEYQRYQERTSAFFPWLPKSST